MNNITLSQLLSEVVNEKYDIMPFVKDLQTYMDKIFRLWDSYYNKDIDSALYELEHYSEKAMIKAKNLEDTIGHLYVNVMGENRIMEMAVPVSNMMIGKFLKDINTAKYNLNRIIGLWRRYMITSDVKIIEELRMWAVKLVMGVNSINYFIAKMKKTQLDYIPIAGIEGSNE